MSIFKEEELTDFTIEDRRDTLEDMIKDIRCKLIGLGLVAGLGKLNLGELDLNSGKEMLKLAAGLIEEGIVSYTLLSARRLHLAEGAE